MANTTHRFDLSGRSRRRFFQAAAASTLAFSPFAQAGEAEPPGLGPRPGYSPQIGTLVSEMTWMRTAVIRAVRGMTQEQLDFLLDAKANRIGALLMHLAATERLYQLNTFDRVNAGIQMMGAKLYKKYRVYEKSLVDGNGDASAN